LATKVPLLDLKPQLESLRDEIHRVVGAVVESQHFILGPEVASFEEEIAAFVGARHAIGCASGTDALILSLAALGIGPGDEVITTPFSFFATASCAVKVGATPRFADILPGTFNLSPAAVEAALGPKTAAILPVHLFGQCAAMDPLLAIAERARVPVVEDACQSLSATYRGARGEAQAGAMGELGCYSFFPSKNLGGFGDGGLIATSDDALAKELRALRVHGETERYHHRVVGWNSRLDALQAAVLRVKLPHLPAWSRARARNAEAYDRLFSDAGLVGAGHVRLPERDPRAGHIFNQYTIRARERDRLAAHLTASSIGWGIYYPVPLHLQECFRDLGYREGDFPEAERASREVLSLPVYPELAASQLEQVVGTIADFYAGRG
jgi:dTDP-4-amino-4,6-dideoxygalactose transaminase